jgi:hypothetical protein
VSFKDRCNEEQRSSYSLHQIPPPKESMKALRESLLVIENTGSYVIRHSPCVTGLHLVVVRRKGQ